MILTADDRVIRVLRSQVADLSVVRRRQASRDSFVELILALADVDDDEPRDLVPAAMVSAEPVLALAA